MIFSKRWTKPEFHRYIGWGNTICVYQGEQPSIADFVSNYNTSYTFTSPDILQLIVKNPKELSGVITDPESSEYAQGLKSFNSGLASWASIHYLYNENIIAQYALEGYYEISDELTTYIGGRIQHQIGSTSHRVTLVPVSSLSDNGVIKFLSTSFSHPDEADENRAIDMVITVSTGV